MIQSLIIDKNTLKINQFQVLQLNELIKFFAFSHENIETNLPHLTTKAYLRKCISRCMV